MKRPVIPTGVSSPTSVAFRMRRALAASVIAALGVGQAAAMAGASAPLSTMASTYLQRCGGCHGIQGRSAPLEVPSLRLQVGYFLCTPAGRAYLIRLPSVATAALSDQELAGLMNFVVFELGDAGGGVTARYAKYSEREVHQLRSRPLNEVALTQYRASIVEELIRQCDAPKGLREYGSEGAHTP